MLKKIAHQRAAFTAQRVYRGYRGRRRARKARIMRTMLLDQNYAALQIERVYRGHVARTRTRRMQATRARDAQFAAARKFHEEHSAHVIQKAWHGYKGRTVANLVREAAAKRKREALMLLFAVLRVQAAMRQKRA